MCKYLDNEYEYSNELMKVTKLIYHVLNKMNSKGHNICQNNHLTGDRISQWIQCIDATDWQSC